MMRNNYILLFFALLFGALLWSSSTGGAANVQGADLTGSPLGGGSCNGCHSGGSFAPLISAELLDGTTVVSQYQPGKAYTLRVRVNANGTPARYGFQAVALTGADNIKAGTFGTAPTGFRKTTLQGREYVEHSSPRTSNTLEIPWTAPTTAGEGVRFYVSGIAANNNGSSSGDASARLASPLQITPMVTSVRESVVRSLNLQVLGNPLDEELRLVLNNPEAGQFRFSLMSVDGRSFWSVQQWLQEGEQLLQWEVGQVPAGIYLLNVENKKGAGAVRIVRR